MNEICRMRTLVIAATKLEISLFQQQHTMVDILVTGVGVPATIYALTKQLLSTNYHLVIQAGIAGAFDNSIELGSAVAVKQDSFGDLGMEENEKFTPIFQSGFLDPNELPFKNGWLVNESPILSGCPLPLVNGITVNKVSDSDLQKKQLIHNFSAQTESMEGAALHYVCIRENIPFIQLRGISNYVGDRDRRNWKMKESIQSVNNALQLIIDSNIER